MKKKLIRLTENDLHNIVNYSAKKVLTEYYGVFNGCENKAIEILSKIRSLWKSNDADECQDFSVECDFCETKKLFITATKLKLRGAYLLDKKWVNGLDVILINPNILYDDDNYIIKTLVHELTHAYEDYQRKLKGSSLLDYAKQTNYANARKWFLNGGDEDNEMKDEIAEIMRYLSTFEVNASLAALNSLVMRPWGGKKFNTVNDVLLYIYDTREYNRLMGYANTARLYAETKDEEEMDDILEALNELSDNKFRTKEQARHYFMVLCNRTERQVEKLIPKLVNAYFEKQRENSQE